MNLFLGWMFILFLHNSNNQRKSCKTMPWIIAKHYQITINLSPTTFFAPVILIQATFISSMTLLLLSCSHPFSTCFTPFSTTNCCSTANKLQHFFRFVTGQSLRNVNCTFGNCGLSLFSNQWKLLKNKKDLPPDFMHAPCMLFPRVRLGWERLVECLVPSPMGWPRQEKTMESLGNLQCFAIATVI